MKKSLITCVLGLAAALGALPAAETSPVLRIGYSDWPGWVAWEIAQQKGFFARHKVSVKLEWFEYGPQMEAFAAGKIDAAGLANGDAIMMNATGTRNVMILINDYSNGNDKIVAVPGINSIKELKGRKIGVETGCLSHLLLLNALQKNGMAEKDVELVNMPTHQAAQTLASGQVAAIVAWQPNSGAALELVKGAKALYTTEDEPGIIYDTLAVSAESLVKHRAEWAKVVAAWYDVIDYLNNPANKDEALKILSARAGISAQKYAGFYSGTRFLSAQEALEKFARTKGYGSIYGSSELADKFFVNNKIYEKPVDVARTIDPGFTRAIAKGLKK